MDILTLPNIVYNRFLKSSDAEVIFLQCLSKNSKSKNDNNPSPIKTQKVHGSPKFNVSPKKIYFQNNTMNLNSKMEFNGFLRAIHMIAYKLYQEYDISKSIQFILDHHILKLDDLIINLKDDDRLPESRPLKLIIEILKDPEMVFENLKLLILIQR